MRKNQIYLYCDPCEVLFSAQRIAGSSITQLATVSCPHCGRKAKVEFRPDGRFQIIHNGYIFVCPKPLYHNPLAVALVYAGVTVVVGMVFATIAKWVSPFMCPVVLVATLMLVGVVGTIQLAVTGGLNKSYVQLMKLFFKNVPTLLGRRVRESKVVPDEDDTPQTVSSGKTAELGIDKVT
jgi:hypothetical protein